MRSVTKLTRRWSQVILMRLYEISKKKMEEARKREKLYIRQEEYRKPTRYHKSRPVIYTMILVVFLFLYFQGNLNLENSNKILFDTVGEMTYIMRNHEVPYEDIDDALTDYISSTEYKDLKHRTNIFYLNGVFLIILLGIIVYLDIQGIFEIHEKRERKVKRPNTFPSKSIRLLKHIYKKRNKNNKLKKENRTKRIM